MGGPPTGSRMRTRLVERRNHDWGCSAGEASPMERGVIGRLEISIIPVLPRPETPVNRSSVIEVETHPTDGAR